MTPEDRNRALDQVLLWSCEELKGTDSQYRFRRVLKGLGTTCKASREIVKPFVDAELARIEQEQVQAREERKAAIRRLAEDDVRKWARDGGEEPWMLPTALEYWEERESDWGRDC